MQTHTHTLTLNDEILKINFHFNDSLRRLILGKRNMGIEFHRTMQHKYSWRNCRGPLGCTMCIQYVASSLKRIFPPKPADNRRSCWFSCFLVTFIANVAWFWFGHILFSLLQGHLLIVFITSLTIITLCSFLSKCFHSVSLQSQSRHIRRWKDLQKFLLRPWRQLKSKYCQRKKKPQFMIHGFTNQKVYIPSP